MISMNGETGRADNVKMMMMLMAMVMENITHSLNNGKNMLMLSLKLLLTNHLDEKSYCMRMSVRKMGLLEIMATTAFVLSFKQ